MEQSVIYCDDKIKLVKLVFDTSRLDQVAKHLIEQKLSRFDVSYRYDCGERNVIAINIDKDTSNDVESLIYNYMMILKDLAEINSITDFEARMEAKIEKLYELVMMLDK